MSGACCAVAPHETRRETPGRGRAAAPECGAPRPWPRHCPLSTVPTLAAAREGARETREDPAMGTRNSQHLCVLQTSIQNYIFK